MKQPTVDIAIIGAGPYGLSLAAHLRKSNRSFRIFGSPMRFWSQHMPEGMCLKSEGFASDLYDPDSEFTLKAYSAREGIPYADIGLPVRLETFVDYAKAFQRHHVPDLEEVNVTSLVAAAEGFELRTDSGETLRARQVVVATGIMNFAHIPKALASMPSTAVTHSSQHSDLTGFKGRHIAVVGGGASALDMAGLLKRAGATVDLVARRPKIPFHSKPVEPRPLVERLKAPRSGLGLGWRSRLCDDLPMVFHAMPASFRTRVVARHLGPAPAWFVRDMVVGHVKMHLGASLKSAAVRDGKVSLVVQDDNGKAEQLDVDHVVAGTGYKVDLSRLSFMDAGITSRIDTVSGAPALNRHFESSVPGLYFVGSAAASSFGPLLRFACGAQFTARRVARRLASN